MYERRKSTEKTQEQNKAQELFKNMQSSNPPTEAGGNARHQAIASPEYRRKRLEVRRIVIELILRCG